MVSIFTLFVIIFKKEEEEAYLRIANANLPAKFFYVHAAQELILCVDSKDMVFPFTTVSFANVLIIDFFF